MCYLLHRCNYNCRKECLSRIVGICTKTGTVCDRSNAYSCTDTSSKCSRCNNYYFLANPATYGGYSSCSSCGVALIKDRSRNIICSGSVSLTSDGSNTNQNACLCPGARFESATFAKVNSETLCYIKCRTTCDLTFGSCCAQGNEYNDCYCNVGSNVQTHAGKNCDIRKFPVYLHYFTSILKMHFNLYKFIIFKSLL